MATYKNTQTGTEIEWDESKGRLIDIWKKVEEKVEEKESGEDDNISSYKNFNEIQKDAPKVEGELAKTSKATYLYTGSKWVKQDG